MARPKKEDAGKARQALVDAFWDLLAEIPYDQISVRTLANRAGVNHNTFYRYFENIDDLAQQALEESLPKELPSRIKEASDRTLSTPLDFFNEDRFQLWSKRVQLCIRSNSLYLNQAVQRLIKETWFNYLGIDEDALSEMERIRFSFMASGMITVFRENQEPINSEFIERLLTDPVFKVLIEKMLTERNSGGEVAKGAL